jgi:antitoxin MazE
MAMKMQIGRWGNSLAVRLPKALVERLGLKEGDEIESSAIETALASTARAEAIQRHDQAIETIKARAWKPNDGWKFNREEYYEELDEERHGKSFR